MISTLFTLDDDKVESIIFNITGKIAIIKSYTRDGEPEACFDVVSLPQKLSNYVFKDVVNGCCEIILAKDVGAASNSLQTLIKTNDCYNTWAVSTTTGAAVISMDGYYKLRLRNPNLKGNYHVTLEYIDPQDISANTYSRYDVSLTNCNCAKPVADPTLPIKGGGFIYRPSDIRDPLATVEIKTCENEVWGYAYPTSSPTAPIPIQSCSGILGYAKATSSVGGLITPDFCS